MFSKGIYIHFNWASEMRKMHQICHTEDLKCLVLVTDFKSLSLKGETVISKEFLEVNNFKSLCQLHRCTFVGVDNCNTVQIQDKYRRNTPNIVCQITLFLNPQAIKIQRHRRLHTKIKSPIESVCVCRPGERNIRILWAACKLYTNEKNAVGSSRIWVRPRANGPEAFLALPNGLW